MAARVTAIEVKVLAPTTVSDADMAVIIEGATLLVDEIAAADATVTAARLKSIERWLAAHFLAASRDPRAKAEGVGSVSETIEGQFGKGFELTRYGQQALQLDPTGTLLAIQDGVSGVATLDVD